MSMTVEQALARVQAGLNELPWRDHEAEIALATLRAELDGLRADAERYRWLRERQEEPDIYVGVDSEAYPGKWALMGEDADAARQEKGHE